LTSEYVLKEYKKYKNSAYSSSSGIFSISFVFSFIKYTKISCNGGVIDQRKKEIKNFLGGLNLLLSRRGEAKKET
jgi:hypothetical protein